MQLRSIRTQLLLWLLIPVVTLGILSSILTYYIAIDFANDAYDDALADSARALASRLHFLRDNKIDIDLPEAAQAILEYDNNDKFFYQVIGPRGRLIAGKNLYLTKEPSSNKVLQFWDGRIQGQKVRIATLKVFINEETQRFSTIHVAETFATRNKLRTEILSSVVFIQLLFILLSAGSVWLGITRGLIPLDKIRQALIKRSPKDLTPLDEESTPTEIQPLAHSINDLMQRLNDYLEIQRRFISNAAHQLRTPIAGLKTHAELAFQADSTEEREHALQQVKISVERTTHLATQLLSLARSEPNAIESQQCQTLDIGHLARNVTREFVPQAMKKHIDLGYEGISTPAYIYGDPIGIQEMLSNLIDNALKYCSSEDQVTVGVVINGDLIDLKVEDTGPGIPRDERDRVFERFYRILRSEVGGSGLGLAIVREIAESHKAKIHLGGDQNDKGTSICISFPVSR